jgi:lipopolysaccharide transport system permease protein
VTSDPSISLSDADECVIRLEAGAISRHYWIDLWRYRELFVILAARDIAVKYKQTAIGLAWALIQPAAMMLIMTVVFGRVVRLDSSTDTPYPLLVLAGMLPWTFFSAAISSASQSMIGNAGLISKVYFPRMIIPVSSIVTSCVDFLVSFVLLLLLMAWYGYPPTINLLALPFLVLVTFLAALGPGLLMTALNVRFRDFRYIVPFCVQLGLYLTPVGFSSDLIRQRLGPVIFYLYALNPLVGIIDAFRWSILGSRMVVEPTSIMISAVVIIATLIAGIAYFRRTEKTFADII